MGILIKKTYLKLVVVLVSSLLWGCSDNWGSTSNGGSYEYNQEDSVPNTEVVGATDPNQDVANETYASPGTNPFVYVAHDPFSTFAADVDSASYDIFRRDINYGTLPAADSVRLEEYVNYFDYGYTAPSLADEHPFAVYMDAGPSLSTPGASLLRIGIKGREMEAADIKPVNMVYLIDVSGSMASDVKLPLVQTVLTDALNVLPAGSTVAIVTYAGSNNIALYPTSIDQSADIASAISTLAAGGSTAGADGINTAYELAESVFIEDGINHVILCTDGDFNVGPSSDAELVALIEDKRISGITLTVLGFGSGNLNDSMMEKVSNAGDGIYAMISSEDQASAFVEDRMLQGIVRIAKDLKIQVEFNPDMVLAYRLLGYENRQLADEDFEIDTVDAGDIGAGHTVTALYELILSDGEVPSPEGAPAATDGAPVDGDRQVATDDMVLVQLKYKDPGTAATVTPYLMEQSLVSLHAAESFDSASFEFQWAAAIAAFAEILRGSPFANPNAIETMDTVFVDDFLDADYAEFSSLYTAAKTML